MDYNYLQIYIRLLTLKTIYLITLELKLVFHEEQFYVIFFKIYIDDLICSSSICNFTMFADDTRYTYFVF